MKQFFWSGFLVLAFTGLGFGPPDDCPKKKAITEADKAWIHTKVLSIKNCIPKELESDWEIELLAEEIPDKLCNEDFKDGTCIPFTLKFQANLKFGSPKRAEQNDRHFLLQTETEELSKFLLGNPSPENQLKLETKMNELNSLSQHYKAEILVHVNRLPGVITSCSPIKKYDHPILRTAFRTDKEIVKGSFSASGYDYPDQFVTHVFLGTWENFIPKATNANRNGCKLEYSLEPVFNYHGKGMQKVKNIYVEIRCGHDLADKLVAQIKWKLLQAINE